MILNKESFSVNCYSLKEKKTLESIIAILMGTLKMGFNLASLLMSQNDPINYLKSSIKMGKWL